MDVAEAIRARRAARSYTAAPVEPAILRRLIEAAVCAPSAMNEQPWDFAVVQDQARLDDISRHAVAHGFDRSGRGALEALHAGILDAPHFNIFYQAPALVVISTRDGPWARENAALAAENLMLAAVGLGLGTCWIGLAQRWLETEAGREAIGCPPGYTPVAPIIVGHPAIPAHPAPRRAPAVRWL